MKANMHIPKEADVISFDVVSIVIASAEYVECVGCSCVVKYCFFCVAIGTSKLQLDVEIIFVAAVVILLLILGRLSVLHTRKVITRFILVIKISITPCIVTTTNIVKMWFNK